MSNRHTIGRRQFLYVSSAAVLATAAVGPKLFAADAASSARRLAVGYAAAVNEAVTSAMSIPSGDGAFIGRGARVAVSGAAGARRTPRSRRAVELQANYSYYEGAERRLTPFRAWASSRATGSSGSVVSFTVPVDEVQHISFTVTAESGAPMAAATRRDALTIEPTETTHLPLTLTLQNEADAFKLVRGYYVIAPLFEGDPEPQWRAWTIGDDAGRAALVDSDGAAATFDHLLLRIDYAAQP